MFRPNRIFSVISLLVIAAFLFTACAPAATAVPTVAPTVAPTQPPAVKIGFFMPSKKTARYDTIDWPFFQAEMQKLCPTCELIHDNSNDDANEQLTAVESAIANGVKVVVVMAVDTKAAAAIADKAKAAGVPYISYARLTQNTDGVTAAILINLEDYGAGIAQSLVDDLNKKGISNPKIALILGSATDSNVPGMYNGHMRVLQPLVDAGKLTIIKTVYTPDWDPAKAQTEAQQLITETGGKIDGVISENDGLAAGIIAAFKSAGITPVPPVTGGDCDLAAIQRILTGDQLSSGYFPISKEAQIAAQLASAIVTTGQLPASMIQGKTNNGTIDVPTVFLPSTNVNIANIKDTVIADGFWSLDKICTPEFDAACKSAGLK
jgi:D-xylose transport system substrate-binding protein